jgi:hypothetical protein
MILFYINKIFKRIGSSLLYFFTNVIIHYFLKGKNVKYINFKTTGVPHIMVATGGIFKIGKFFTMNNGIRGNPIGCYERCTFFG